VAAKKEVWVQDGGAPVAPEEPTSGLGASAHSAFDAGSEIGHMDIWAIRIEGPGLRQVTRDPGLENVPSWSRDGRFIYYSSNRTGRFEV
jgi:hypothetical protein